MRVAAVAVCVIAAVPAAPAAERQVLPFTLMDDGSIVVPVSIAGGGPFRFVVDTGSTRTAVSRRLATELRLPAVANSQLVTPLGSRSELIVMLPAVALGGLPPTPITALLSPRDDLAAGRRVDGLIGQDVLASQVYTIDYIRRQIVWNWEPEAGRTATRLPLDYAQGRFLITLPQEPGESSPLQFIPDSGSDGVVLFARPSRPLPPFTPLNVGLLSTLTGHTLVRRALLDRLKVGAIVLRDQPAVVVPQPGPTTPFGDGLLPLHLFARVTFNGPARYLVLEAKRGRG